MLLLEVVGLQLHFPPTICMLAEAAGRCSPQHLEATTLTALDYHVAEGFFTVRCTQYIRMQLARPNYGITVHSHRDFYACSTQHRDSLLGPQQNLSDSGKSKVQSRMATIVCNMFLEEMTSFKCTSTQCCSAHHYYQYGNSYMMISETRVSLYAIKRSRNDWQLELALLKRQIGFIYF